MTKKQDPRKTAFDILFNVFEKGQYSHIELQKFYKSDIIYDERDRAFVERLIRGCLERKIELDEWINLCSKLPVKKLKPIIRTILRMSVYQLKYMDSIPSHAVCSEAVKLTSRLGLYRLKGYVNGTLRNIDRKLADIEFPLEENYSIIKKWSVIYSTPEWIVDYICDLKGKECAEQILKAQFDPVKLSIYRNKCNISDNFLKDNIEKSGGICEKLPYNIDGYYIKNIKNIDKIESFSNGEFLIQDVSSMIQGMVVSAHKDEHIIDVCAAPGGKSFHAAIDMKNTGFVESFDISDLKVKLIKENLKRLNLNNVKTKVHDALVLDKDLVETADIVIADLPCSGLGIIGRKPEIKYNITYDDVKALAKLQKDILDIVYQYVKPGGRLIYSTCTFTKEENEENFRYITEKLPFSCESLDSYLPSELLSKTTKNGYIQLLLGIDKCDGFFVSSAVRNKKELS